jgi:hypothetical protein
VRPKALAVLSYGVNVPDLFHRAGVYEDKKPGDLPIQQPTKFELVIMGIKPPTSTDSRNAWMFGSRLRTVPPNLKLRGGVRRVPERGPGGWSRAVEAASARRPSASHRSTPRGIRR